MPALKEKKWRVAFTICLWILTPNALSAFGEDLSSIASDYVRTDFTIEDGLPDNRVNCVIQTGNGLLWVGTESGLASFDGRTFVPVRLRVPGAAPPGAVNSLLEGPDGDLWIGTDGGIIRIPKSDLNDPYFASSTAYRIGREQSDDVEVLFKARDGTIWAGTNHGLYRFDQHRFVSALALSDISRIQQALDGKLLLISGSGPLEFDGHTAIYHPELGPRFGVKYNDIFDVFQDDRGTIWYCTEHGVRAVGIHAPAHLNPGRPASTATFRISTDSKGRLWILTGVGVYQVREEHLDSPAPGLLARTFYARDDGDLWLGTTASGLIHLQPRLAHVFTKADGLPNDISMTVLRADDGRIWVGNNCGLTVFDGKRFKLFVEKDGLTNSCVWSLAEDRKHNIWIGTYGGGLFRFDGRFQQFSIEQGLASRIVLRVAVAWDDSLWIATPDGLSHMKDGRIRNYTTVDGLSSDRILDIHEDRARTIWVATQGGVDRYFQGRFSPLQHTHAMDDLLARRFAEDSEGHLYTSDAPQGISRIVGQEVLPVEDRLSLMDMVESTDHNLWFSSRDGLIRIAEQELAHYGDSDAPLSYEKIDRADGLLSTEASIGSPNIAIAPNGKIWLATVKGLAVVDTTHLLRVRRKPKVFVSNALVDGVRERVRNELVLSPGNHHLELQLAAIDLAAAQKVQLQYRLEEVDSNWLDVSRTRTAVYTNIPPGAHRFFVRSTDSHGTWDAGAVVYQLLQRPFFYQTRLFQVGATITLLLLLVISYLARVRYLIKQTSAILEERQVERESVARDLHDTFLQGIQGLILRFHTGTQQLPVDQPTRRLFEDALQQSDQVMLEGRSVLSRLRMRQTSSESLPVALTAVGNEFRQLSTAQFDVIVSGRTRSLGKVVEEELHNVAREALFNAFRHGQSKKIEVEVHFGIFELRLRFRDDGVGIEPAILREGSVPGHYGLPGMRERVRKIGGHMELWSRSGAGTEIDVRIPSAIAYRNRETRYRESFLQRVLRTKSS